MHPRCGRLTSIKPKPGARIRQAGDQEGLVLDDHAAELDMTGINLAIISTAFLLLAVPTVAQTKAGEIEMANRQFVQAVNKGDAAMMARMYTENAVVLPPRAEMVEGREAIQDYWRGVIAAGLKNLALSSVRIDEFGADTVREIGRFSAEILEPRERAGAIEGKYVTVWRNNGDGWRRDSDIWNFTGGAEVSD
jgi:uncharacterized protein (TIGR02246 family)